MIGQNGVGKSGEVVNFYRVYSLIRICSPNVIINILVGLPQDVRILHIAQLEEVTSGRTILQEIISETRIAQLLPRKPKVRSPTIFNPQ